MFQPIFGELKHQRRFVLQMFWGQLKIFLSRYLWSGQVFQRPAKENNIKSRRRNDRQRHSNDQIRLLQKRRKHSFTKSNGVQKMKNEDACVSYKHDLFIRGAPRGVIESIWICGRDLLVYPLLRQGTMLLVLYIQILGSLGYFSLLDKYSLQFLASVSLLRIKITL